MFGAAKSRQQTHAPTRADDLAEIVLRDLDGHDVRLGDTWSERPAVLAFLRHYGWVFCREHAMQLHRDREEFDAAGARLVVIGQGEPEDGRRFVEKHGLDGLPLLVDTDRESYAAAGTKVATIDELVGPAMLAKGVMRALRSGQRQGRTVGHNAQLGGVLVVDMEGDVTYAHLSDDASDNPPNDEVIDAAREAASG